MVLLLVYSDLIIGHEQRTGCSIKYPSPVNLNKVLTAAYCFATIITQVDNWHWLVVTLICGLRLMCK